MDVRILAHPTPKYPSHLCFQKGSLGRLSEPSELSVVLEEGGTWSDGGLFSPEDALHLGDGVLTQADLELHPRPRVGRRAGPWSGECWSRRERRPKTLHDDEGDSDPDDLDEDVHCPKEEETVQTSRQS